MELDEQQLALTLNDLRQFQDSPKSATLSIIILDKSGSMGRFGDAPRECVNGHLEKLKNPPDSRAQYCAIITFNGQYRLELPLAKIEPEKSVSLENYDASGNTLLWKTVYKTIKLFLKELPKKEGLDLQIIVGVFTDGEDTDSDREDYPEKLQRISREAQKAGWQLYSFGIGVNAKSLANDLGFPDDEAHAINVPMNVQDLKKAVNSFTTTTTSFFGTRACDKPAK